MKKLYIAPCCEFEAIDAEEMVMSSVFDDSVTTGAHDTDENIVLPGTTPGGSKPEPTTPDGPIEAGAKKNSIYFDLDW